MRPLHGRSLVRLSHEARTLLLQIFPLVVALGAAIGTSSVAGDATLCHHRFPGDLVIRAVPGPLLRRGPD